MTCPDLLFNGPDNARVTVALAHGAGAPMDSPFMDYFAEGLATTGFRVARFEFPYMVERRKTGKKRPPNTAKVLLETWGLVIDELGPENLIIGGKSMGGRIASMVADDKSVSGLVCLGYPFHPPGKPEKTRIEHLAELKTPAMFLQGTRDTLGGIDEVSGYPLSKKINIHWLEDGDHGLKPRKKSGRTEEQNWAEALDAFTAFAEKR
ncbi:MAG: alpha/beta hydrolase [Rhodospirillaceae bacterium]|nr:alpha/beta hydrolase [Rhodospirillaceae bacterium]MBT4218734.1 alpha/beta hydrolase [Rhodospirillaceae bacterium]MBT4463095.1 alpha/beta hydrolase [Rhodospirillaceae bacterium]MBT5013824.1 alpha/beta hydrolase [Rhodospirillaceae bacterium]MBT5308679.1 alpha/beta hydrolase [Rhodospirillaceae bacterium]